MHGTFIVAKLCLFKFMICRSMSWPFRPYLVNTRVLTSGIVNSLLQYQTNFDSKTNPVLPNALTVPFRFLHSYVSVVTILVQP